jgi:hypothetical protein
MRSETPTAVVLLAAACLSVLAGGRPAAASAPTLRETHPWGFGASFSWVQTGTPAFASVGAAAERALWRYLTVEAAAETGLNALQADAAATRFDPKLVARLGAAPTLPLDSDEQNLLFAWAGPELFVGRAYDRLPLAHVEAGYKLRTWMGLSLVGAATANFALERRAAIVPAGSCLSSCDGPIRYGTRSIGFRFGLGGNF